MVYNADSLKNWSEQAEVDGKWVCARPINYQVVPFFQKLKIAWRGFRGKYDALEWTKQ